MTARHGRIFAAVGFALTMLFLAAVLIGQTAKAADSLHAKTPCAPISGLVKSAIGQSVHVAQLSDSVRGVITRFLAKDGIDTSPNDQAVAVIGDERAYVALAHRGCVVGIAEANRTGLLIVLELAENGEFDRR